MNEPVLVIDLQTAMFDGVSIPPIHQADMLVAKTRAVLDWARRTGHPVAFIRHDAEAGDPLEAGQPGWPVWPALGQAADEPTFGKNVGDAFSNPKLEAWLSGHGAKRVILLGAQSDFCVSATSKGALAKGFAVILLGYAHSTWGADGKTAQQIIEAANLELGAAGAEIVTVAKLTGA